MAGKNEHTSLAAGSSFKGDISVSKTIRIDGNFEGKINCGENLYVGENGFVKADITSKAMLIEGGKVEGNIKCDTTIELTKKATIIGNITAKEIIIDKGCVFHGNSVMLDKKGKPHAEPVKKPEEAELELEELK